jgi:glyoxylase-like metal-dependent hydrolase (beta-lactamase superfamily II)
MFPNYVDAIPTQLAQSARALRRSGGDTVYVPGHGALGRVADFDRYTAMIEEVERAARAAYAHGTSASDASAAFTLPVSLGDWTLFGKTFYNRAFEAWYRELAAKGS